MTTTPPQDAKFALSTEQYEVLIDEHILRPSPNPRKRLVNTQLLSPPSSNEVSPPDSSRIYGAPVTYSRISPSTTPDTDFELPTDPISVEGVEYLGFSRSTAQKLFNRWSGRPDPSQNRDGLVDYACAEVSRLCVPPLSNYSPIQAMDAIGISKDLQKVFLDPEFTQILWTRSIEFWLEETVRGRWWILLQLHDRLKETAITSLSRKEGNKRRKIESKSEDPFNLAPEEIESPMHTASILAPSKGMSLPAAFTVVEAEPKRYEDHIVLWKSMDPTRVGSDPLIRADGKLRIQALASSPGGDFNPTNYAWYWTFERETAEKFRKWAAHRYPELETWLIQVQIPKEFVSTLNTAQMYYSKDWKELVWLCMHKSESDTIPAKFKDILGGDLPEGNICTGDSSNLIGIAYEEVDSKITEDFLVKQNGKRATQWVILNEQAALRMRDEANGKIHIIIHEAKSASGGKAN